MPNQIRFLDYNDYEVGLTKTEVRDLVDVLFRTGDGHFTIYGEMRAGEKKTTRGLCVSNGLFGGIEIYLAPDRIRNSFSRGSPVGGNRPAASYKMAVAAVLAHELQHANQHQVHESGHSSFFGKNRSRYRSRACEREARNFADENVGVIARVLGIEVPVQKSEDIPKEELWQVAESLAEVDGLTVADIVDELRRSGLNNASNVGTVKEILLQGGTHVG